MDINGSMNDVVSECNKEFDCAPILIIGFNRPAFMRQQIRNIAVCGNVSYLY